MKGIVLAGGRGTRLYPSTIALSKQLLPIYDKPMIYYSISVLMLAGIRDILIISTPEHLPLYEKLLGNGSHIGLDIIYKIQKKPKGLADALIIGEKFISDDNVAFLLGDNIFYGHDLINQIEKAAAIKNGALIFGYYVENPTKYGVVEFDKNYNVLSIEEKPNKPKSNYVIPGIYFFDNNVIEIAKSIKPSTRGELEITSVLENYLKQDKLKIEILGRGIAWLDAGTHESLIEASSFIQAIEKRQGLKIACLEEIAYQKKFIDLEKLKKAAKMTEKSDYGKYLRKMIKNIEKYSSITCEKKSLEKIFETL